MDSAVTSWPTLILLGVVFAFLIKQLIDFVKELWLLPPGPWGLPIVGYLPWINREAYLTFAQLGKKYGGLFSIKMGGDTVVVLNDWPTIKATLADHPRTFSGRPYIFIMEVIGERKDISLSDGPTWQKQKRLTIQCLRNIGMGKKSTESIVTEIVHQLSDKLSKLDDQVVPMESVFFGPILKVKWEMISGNTVSDDTAIKKWEASIDDIMSCSASNGHLVIFPWLRFIPPNGCGFKHLINSNKGLKNLVKNSINEHLEAWKEGSEVDLIDHYIAEIKRHKDIFGKEEPPYNVDHLTGTIYDVFIGAVHTNNAICQWAFLHLAFNAHVQQKAHAELDSVVGKHRMINVNDFPSLPYLDALIKEVHRVSSIIPLSAPHCPIKDFRIQGYTIPKGTTCLQNIYAVHHDPELWEKPEVFRPERFLDKDNKPFWPPYLMPFSIGSRICPGQSMADMALKLIIGGLLQKFTFSLPKNLQKPTLRPEFKFILSPKPYSLHIQQRF